MSVHHVAVKFKSRSPQVKISWQCFVPKHVLFSRLLLLVICMFEGFQLSKFNLLALAQFCAFVCGCTVFSVIVMGVQRHENADKVNSICF